MKNLNKTLVLLTLITSSLTMAASPRDCGLPESISSDGVSDIGTLVRLRSASDLTSLQKQQVFLAAKKLMERAEEVADLESATDAIEYLRGGSDGGDADLSHFKYDGEKFTVVRHYPGDNAYGVIFNYGTKHIVATFADGDISCE